MKEGTITVLLAGTLWLSGCMLYTKPVVPSPENPDVFKVTIPESYSALNNRWWENFNNVQLNTLVELAITNNYNYLVALKNIDIAQTYVLQNMTLLFPQVGLDYEISRNKHIVNVGNSVSSAPQLTGGTGANAITNLQILTMTATYEIDIWNQVHNSVDQAKADKMTAEGNTNVIRLTLVSSVVNTYFQIMALTENISNLDAQHKAASEIAELTEVRFQAGLVDESTVYVARNQAEIILSTLKTIQKQKEVLEFTLAYLVGEYPENFVINIQGKLGDLDYAKLVPESIPSTMLGMRPDVQAAFTTVLSFGYIEKQNIANFLPNISLSGTYGYANSTISHLINPTNVLWNYGMSVLQSIINYPALYSQWKRSQIQFESAVLSYKNSVINAFVEVDSALVSYKEDDLVMNSYNRQLKNSEEILNIASAHYAAGLTGYIDYLSNDLTLLQTDYNLTLKELIVTQDIVQVYKTLGLGIKND